MLTLVLEATLAKGTLLTYDKIWKYKLTSRAEFLITFLLNCIYIVHNLLHWILPYHCYLTKFLNRFWCYDYHNISIMLGSLSFKKTNQNPRTMRSIIVKIHIRILTIIILTSLPPKVPAVIWFGGLKGRHQSVVKNMPKR